MKYRLEVLPIHETNKDKKEQQTAKDPKGAIVLIHGICHGAWCWEKFITFFADHRYQCYAISLPGHGKSDGKEHLQEYHLSDYVEAIKETMGIIRADMDAHHNLKDVKPFILGHSMGGAIVQQYIGKYEDDVQGAILFAPATAPHMTSKDVLRFFPINLFFASLIALFGCNCKFVVHQAAFFTGKTKNGKLCQRVKDTSSYQRLLQKESKEIVGRVTLKPPFFEHGDLTKPYSDNYKVNIPILVIGSDADLYFPEDKLEKTAGAYASNEKTALVILKRLCHDMMLDEGWKRSAMPVLKFVNSPSTYVKDHQFTKIEHQQLPPKNTKKHFFDCFLYKFSKPRANTKNTNQQ